MSRGERWMLASVIVLALAVSLVAGLPRYVIGPKPLRKDVEAKMRMIAAALKLYAQNNFDQLPVPDRIVPALAAGGRITADDFRVAHAPEGEPSFFLLYPVSNGAWVASYGWIRRQAVLVSNPALFPNRHDVLVAFNHGVIEWEAPNIAPQLDSGRQYAVPVR